MPLIVVGQHKSGHLGEKKFVTVERGIYAYDGYQLTELNINVDLHSEKDFEDLKTFLKVHERCFRVGGKWINKSKDDE